MRISKVLQAVGFTALFANSAIAQDVALKTPEAALIGHGMFGAIYQAQAPHANQKIGVVVMHAEGDYTQFSAGPELAKRGFTVLNANNSAAKQTGNDIEFERSMLELGKAVKYMRERPGIEKVVLLGHSGGGAMSAAYQNIAENGLSACQGKEKIAPCSAALKDLPKADGIVLLDANYGLSTMTLLSLSPQLAVDNALHVDEKLDLFAPQNGLTAQGATYSAAFRQAFQHASAKRMNDLIGHALARKALLDKGEGQFADDEPLVVAGSNYLGGNNKMFSQDPSMLAHTSNKQHLVHKDGTITHEIVHSTRPARNLTYGMALRTTVKRFLNTYAIRVDEQNYAIHADGFSGIDWDSTHTSPISAAKGISAPLLAVGLTGNWEYLAAEKIVENARSQDKEAVFIEGASHVVTPIEEKYGNTVKLTYDYIAQWLGSGRFN